MRHAACYRITGTDEIDGQVVETFEASEGTSSAWGRHMQHGGPVAALLVRAIERVGDADGRRVARVTTDLLGMVPMGPVRVRAWVARPGRRIELVEAVMAAPTPDGSWRDVARSSAWRLTRSATEDVARAADRALALPGCQPHRLSEHPLTFAWWKGGFVDELEWKISAEQQHGSSTVAWARLKAPLVEGEDPSPLQRLVAFADTANGVGARLDPAQFSFLNTEMTVHLYDAPAGEWFAIDAESSAGADGIGMSAGVLHAPERPIGRVTQTLLVQRRET